MTSGHPACGVVPVNRGAGGVMSLTSNLGGRVDVLPCPDEDLLFDWLDDDSEATDALRNACFCCATAMGERMSLMCLSMKTGFFFTSLSFWKSRRGFSS
jgi:hypothetical protein